MRVAFRELGWQLSTQTADDATRPVDWDPCGLPMATASWPGMGASSRKAVAGKVPRST